MIYNNFELYNVAELIPNADGGFNMSRLPSKVRSAMGDQGQRMALRTAGCEIRFVLNSGKAEITLRTARPGSTTVAFVYYGGVLAGWTTISHLITDKPSTITLENPEDASRVKEFNDASGYKFDSKVIRICFDAAELILLDAKGDVRVPYPSETPEKRFMMYGSSITQGSLANSHLMTYLSQISNRLNCDCYCYGFAGACLLEDEVCEYVSEQNSELNDRRWDFAVLELGINAMHLENDEYERRVNNLIDKMLTKNPGKKLFVIDIFYNIGDFCGNKKLDAFRAIVAKACVDCAASHPELMHIDGRTLLTGPRGLSADYVHPNAFGDCEIADRLGGILEGNTK